MAQDSTTRFSNRVADYVKYRPGYPSGIITYLQEQEALATDLPIADIGAGTGISSTLFLKAGYEVTAVEPNKEMREKAVELLAGYKGFHAVDGTAENTGLPASAFGAVIAGQAFHWFDAKKARNEFKRILKVTGVVVLIWNERKTGSAFEKEYDELIIRHGKDYVQVDHRQIDDEHMAAFFHPAPFRLRVFQNKQVFDLEGLKGRLLSSSYMPSKNEEGYDAMLADLEQLFGQYQDNGRITIHYDTKVYTGRLVVV